MPEALERYWECWPTQLRHTNNEFVHFLRKVDKEVAQGPCRAPDLGQLRRPWPTNVDVWLAEHPRLQVLHSRKHASRLNQAELAFSILTRRLLKRGGVPGKAY